MKEFVDFLKRIAKHLGIKTTRLQLPTNEQEQCRLASAILDEINKFFYQTNSSLPREYISKFHSFWEKYHEKVLDPQIDRPTCLKVAQVLEDVFQNTEVKIAVDPVGLTNEQIAQVRFFTAIQDFKIDIGRRGNPFAIYKQKPECFDVKKILQNELLVDTFLTLIGAESQRDKRKDWMIASRSFLTRNIKGQPMRSVSDTWGIP